MPSEHEFGSVRLHVSVLTQPTRTRVVVACDDFRRHDGHVRLFHQGLPEKAAFLRWEDPAIYVVEHPGQYESFVASFDGLPEARGVVE